VCFQNAFEEGGVLYDKKVYLFGCTERKWLPEFILFVDLKATDLLGVLFSLNYLVGHPLTMIFWLQLNNSCSRGKKKLSGYLLLSL